MAIYQEQQLQEVSKQFQIYGEILHAKLLGEGRISSHLDADYFQQLKNGVLSWDGQAWVSQPSFSRQ